MASNPQQSSDDNAASDQDDHEDGISFEELGEAYAKAIGRSDEALPAEPQSDHEIDSGEPPEALPPEADATSLADEDAEALPTPMAIIEAALFIGNPEGRAMSEAELAALMRGVTAEEVSRYVDRLNEGYLANEQAFRIHRDDDGLRMGVAPDMEIVRRAFYGKIRETRLSQPAIEVLSLVAYQPGITADKVQDQRGKESGSLLSQLVRRRLLEQRRVVPEGGTRPVATYYPTERFLQLFGLDSLDDLPQVES